MDQDEDDREADVLLQALESETGSANAYRLALQCSRNPELREALERCIAQAEGRRRLLVSLCNEAGLDPSTQTPGRAQMRQVLQSLASAMRLALREGPGEVAETVAARCVVHAETSSINWDLVHEVARLMRRRRERLAALLGWARSPDAPAAPGQP